MPIKVTRRLYYIFCCIIGESFVMFSILITVLIFFFAFAMQLAIVRILRNLHIHTFFSFSIYIVGLIVFILFGFPGDFSYTSILIYILLTLLLMTSSPVPLLGLNSPSSIIVTILEKEKKVTTTQLYRAFDERQLILARLNDLVDVGLVRRRAAGTYIILQKGLLISQFIAVCRVLMGLKNN